MTIASKLAEVMMNWNLRSGKHEPEQIESGEACVMEAVAYVAGEPLSDHPDCVCPVLAAFGRSWNDSLPSDAERDRLLKPLIPRLIGTKSTPTVEERRSYMALDWLIRVHTPTWLERVESLRPHASALRDLEEIADMAGAVTAGEKVRAARAAAWDAAWAAVRDAARDAVGVAAWGVAGDAAAWDAARATAGAAAWAAARAAARAAAWDAARDAARAVAWDAAWAAVRAAAWAAVGAAAGDAAGDALRPTVAELQVSALALVDRMIDVRNGELAKEPQPCHCGAKGAQWCSCGPIAETE
jgi:hypothetical protein